MDACHKHASTDKTKDDNKKEKGKGNTPNGGKPDNGSGQNNNDNNNNNGNQNKRPYDGGSELVANANTGFQKPRTDGNYNGGNNYRGMPRLNNRIEVFRMSCPRHSQNGRPANHSLEQCVDLQM